VGFVSVRLAAGVTYTFDGTGERVKDSSLRLYWYGVDGSVLAETDTSGNTVNEYVFFDGIRVARRDSSGNVYYYFGNVLGSAAITTATGSLCGMCCWVHRSRWARWQWSGRSWPRSWPCGRSLSSAIGRAQDHG